MPSLDAHRITQHVVDGVGLIAGLHTNIFKSATTFAGGNLISPVRRERAYHRPFRFTSAAGLEPTLLLPLPPLFPAAAAPSPGLRFVHHPTDRDKDSTSRLPRSTA